MTMLIARRSRWGTGWAFGQVRTRFGIGWRVRKAWGCRSAQCAMHRTRADCRGGMQPAIGVDGGPGWVGSTAAYWGGRLGLQVSAQTLRDRLASPWRMRLQAGPMCDAPHALSLLGVHAAYVGLDIGRDG
jgi:hypothetical protein